MVDLLLTATGDVAFIETKEEKSRLKLTFFKTSGKAVKINFYTENIEEPKASNNGLTIKFNIENIKNNKRILTVKNDAYRVQQIKMRIKTSLGELPERTNIGSTLETVIHKRLYDSDVISKTKSIITEALTDIIEDLYIEAEPIIKKVDSYEQLMRIYIYSGNNLLLTYETE